MLPLYVSYVVVLSFALLLIPLMLNNGADALCSSLVMISGHDASTQCNDVRDRHDAEEPENVWTGVLIVLRIDLRCKLMQSTTENSSGIVEDVRRSCVPLIPHAKFAIGQALWFVSAAKTIRTRTISSGSAVTHVRCELSLVIA